MSAQIFQDILTKKVIIWDNDGTIMGSQNPHDTSLAAKVILPNVEKTMHATPAVHVICSGCRTPESELQYFDPEKVIEKLSVLMKQLPIAMATFSPAPGGSQCYVVIKSGNGIRVNKAHEDARYQHLIGKFKKPDTGMLHVINDIVKEEFGIILDGDNVMMIGDSWHDRDAAYGMNIPFLEARVIHELPDKV